jgi:parallel beta-helix repeat protein
MLKNKRSIIFILLLIAFFIISASAAEEYVSQNLKIDNNTFIKNKVHSKIESNLLKEKQGVFKPQFQNQDTIKVVFDLKNGDKSYIKSLEDKGAMIEAVHKNLVQATIPSSQLQAMSDLPFVNYIRSPLKAYKDAVVSEGVGVINASLVHNNGSRGQGVKVAIIDLGFGNYQSKLGTELPSTVTVQSFRTDGDITGGGEIHGTAVAEIVYDVAPDAQLYLINFDTDIEFANAVDYAISQNVDIVSMSVVWFVGPFDGTGYIDDIVNNATSEGIVWVNSAGNYAQRHWEGSYIEKNITVDDDTWYVHNFGGGDVTNSFYAQAGDTIVAILSWNDWPASDQDYDLYLANEDTMSIEDWSWNFQTGTQEPYEIIKYPVPTSGHYGIIIQKDSATTPVNFELYMIYHSPQYQVASSSLNLPADARDVITAGATYWSTDALESFSSQGPTNDGRTKPDVVAPDGVSTSVPLLSPFYGTSASAPHVAGAAALLLSTNHSLTPAQVKAALEMGAKDLGAAGKDNQTGAGRIDVYAAYKIVSPANTDGGARNVSSCTTISSPGEYVLNRSIINSTASTCFNITSSNVIFDGAGNMIDGIATWGTYAVHVHNSTATLTNVSVKNVKVTDWGYGVYYHNTANGGIINNIVSSNYNHGITLFDSSGNTVSDNTANSNGGEGIEIAYYSSNNILINNTAQENGYYDIYSSLSVCNNVIKNNTGSGNRPIKYFNNSINFQNEVLSELILCDADNSNINNVTIEGSATKMNNGLLVISTDNSNIMNIKSSNNYKGVLLYRSNGNNLTNNTVNSNIMGIDLEFSTSNNLTNITANSNSDGFGIYESDYNTLAGNAANSNSYGISVIGTSSSNNRVYNNIFNNTNNFQLISTIYTNHWNITKAAGTNIIGGSYLGGNFWANPDGTGFSQSCTDVNGDGICDSSYTLDANNTDYLPLASIPARPNISFDTPRVNLSLNSTRKLNLTLDSAPGGLSGYNITISLSNASVAEIISVDYPVWAPLNLSSSLPGDSVWLKATDLSNSIQNGSRNILLATLNLRGDAPGKSNILITVTSMDDDTGDEIDPSSIASIVEVSAVVRFPCDVCNIPTDPDEDGIYEDINGNCRKDFNDVVLFFNYLEWVPDHEPITSFDFNGNGRIDFNDIIKLFEEL